MSFRRRVHILKKMAEEPETYGFFSLCRWMDARFHEYPGVESSPRRECWRLKQQPIVAFAPSELISIKQKNGKIHVTQAGLGLLGPDGPMPFHFTELARERNDKFRDSTLLDFLNMFQHRWLTMFYRAWASAQAAAGLDHAHDEKFSFFISSLIGNNIKEITGVTLPWHARLSAVSHLVMRSRNAGALAATLRHFFRLPIRVREFTFHWMALSASEYSYLGREENARLGVSAVLGGSIPDRQCNFLLDIGPMKLKDYEAFLPKGRLSPLLLDWVRAFVGLELRWVIRLNLHHEEVPRARLGGKEQLGRTVWLSSPEDKKTVKGMVYVPEDRIKN